MSEPTLSVTIDRSSLSLGDLVFSGNDDGAALQITSYSPPDLITQVGYMPESQDVHGSEAISAKYLQGILSFTWYRADAASESVVQAAYAEVAAAVGQFSFAVETQVSGAPAQTWRADAGSIALGGSNGRTYVDLVTRTPLYTVTIPVYPIPES